MPREPDAYPSLLVLIPFLSIKFDIGKLKFGRCAGAIVVVSAAALVLTAIGTRAAEAPEHLGFAGFDATKIRTRRSKPEPADMFTYVEAGNWSSLWWLPESGSGPVPGAQMAIVPGETSMLPHLIFVPPGKAPSGGWPMIVFLHGQGESSPTPLPRVALQGPPQHAGRNPSTLPFVVLSPQKPMRSQFYDDDVASGTSIHPTLSWLTSFWNHSQAVWCVFCACFVLLSRNRCAHKALHGGAIP